jgi:ABC-type lipoprotein export system ATPase subunit
MFTAREPETQSLLKHVRKQRSVLVLGRGGIGKSALLEHAAGIKAQSPTRFQGPLNALEDALVRFIIPVKHLGHGDNLISSHPV